MNPWVVFGLGNPGPQYATSRHNVGFMAIDSFLNSLPAPQILDRGERERFLWWKVAAPIQPLILVKPMTFMNLSDEAYKDALGIFRFEPQETLIIYDDVSMNLGKIRIRSKGSSGGQKGIDAILRLLETQEIKRIKMGIGPKPERRALSDFVLEPFTEEELPILKKMVDRVVQLLHMMRRMDFEKALNLFSRQRAQGEADEVQPM